MHKIKDFFYSSIRNKLFAVLLLAVAAPMFLFGVVLFSTSGQSLSRQVMNTYTQTTNQISVTFRQYLYSTDQTNRSVDNKPYIVDWMKNQLFSFIDDKHNTVALEKQALVSLKDIVLSNDSIYSLTAITMNGKKISFVNKNYDITLNDYSSNYYAPLSNSTGDMVVLPAKETQYTNSPSVSVFTVAFKHMDVTTDNYAGIEEYTGYIIAECKTDIFAQFCENIDMGDGSALYIIDNAGNLVYTNYNEPNINARVLDKLNDDFEDESIIINNKKHYVAKSAIPDTQWYIYSVIPEELFLKNLSHLKLTFILLCVFAVVIVFFIAYFVSKTFTKPINNLLDSMRKISKGDLSLRLEEQRSDEFGELSSGFNNLMDKINSLISDVSESESRKLTAQYQMLQSQINPHFLYNTLDTIRMMALLEDKDDIAKALLYLSNLFRYSTRNTKFLVPVEEEIKQIENYLYLQKLRFGDKFEIDLQIDKQVYGHNIPKMLLQPLVENIFNHAFSDLEKNGLIIIRVKKSKKYLCFEIEDNGKGMSKKRLNEIRSVLKRKSPPDSIGLSNVNERLRLYYSRSLSIKSSVDEGTLIAFEIPLNEQNSALYLYEEKQENIKEISLNE